MFIYIYNVLYFHLFFLLLMTFGCFQLWVVTKEAAINILIKKRFPGWLPLPQVPVIPQKQLKFAQRTPPQTSAHPGAPEPCPLHGVGPLAGWSHLLR